MLITKLTPELECLDFEKSLRFYIDVVGYSVQYRRPDFAMLLLEETRLMINQSKGEWQTGSLEYPLGRGVNFQIQISDVDAIYSRIVKAGHPIFVPMEEVWYQANDILLGQRQFLVQDPDGYLLRFNQSLGTKPVTA